MIRVQKFIREHWDGKSPLLLGLSGGPDSRALLFALLKTEARSHLHVAHIDHGWREESANEAFLLSVEAARLGVPFHSIRLGQKPTQNWEEAGRIARLGFFRSLFNQFPFQALLLAHHADDVAETVLKRLFEGANISNLGGMAPVGAIDGMAVWRPLIGLKKQEILGWGYGGFEDVTNKDPRFLRGRLRENIIPHLSRQFGKEISSNLALLSQRSFELREYLDRKTDHVEIIQGPWGSAVDIKDLEQIEAHHVLAKLTGTRMEIKAKGGWVFLCRSDLPMFGEEIELSPGHFVSGNWEMDVQPVQEVSKGSWKDVWRGTFEIDLPDGVLQPPSKILGEEYRIAQIPKQIRSGIPVLKTGGEVKNIFSKLTNPRWRVRFFVNARYLA